MSESELYTVHRDRPPKLPYKRTGLWRVVASTGEVSSAVEYDTARNILGAWKKRPEFRGVRFKIVPNE